MRIVSVNLYRLVLKLRRRFSHAAGSRDFTENLLLKVELSDGSVGYGECVPRSYVTGETVATAARAIAGLKLPQSWQACTELTEVLHQLSALDYGPGPRKFFNSARCAVELGVLDAYCRANNRPLDHCVELLLPEAFAPVSRCNYSGVIGGWSGWRLTRSAFTQNIFGFGAFKLKVGMPGHDDAERIGRVRRIIGQNKLLRVDVNSGWAHERVIENAQALAKLGIEAIEQPFRSDDEEKLFGIQDKVSIPLVADESVCDLADAVKVRDLRLASRLNLRLSKCGGVTGLLALVRFARENGLSYQLGCQVGESAILSAAGRQMACALKDLTAAEGSYDRYLLQQNVGDMTFGFGGVGKRLIGSGIGFVPQLDKVKSITSVSYE